VGPDFQVNQLVNSTELMTLSLEVIFKFATDTWSQVKKANALRDVLGILNDIFQQLTPLYGCCVVRRTIS